MTSAPSGGFGIVWESWVQEGFFPGVFGQRYDSSGAPLGAEFRVNTHTMGNQIRPAAASDAAGNFVVVWNGFDADSYGVFGQRFAADGSPVGSEFRVNTHTTDSQSDPHVGVDALGNFAVVWESRTQDGSEYGVFGQRFDISVPWVRSFVSAPTRKMTSGRRPWPRMRPAISLSSGQARRRAYIGISMANATARSCPWS